MTTILITGATGFVGHHILEALRDRPVKVIAACRDRYALPPWFMGEVREGDLRDPAYRDRLCQGVDVLCHAAAWSSLYGNKDNVRQRFLLPTQSLLEQAAAAGVARIVFPSTHGATNGDPGLWPHLSAVIRIEADLQKMASDRLTTVSLRLGLFAGKNYSLGLLPILVPRLKTHLVPWVAGGCTPMPLTDGRDIGQAFALAATHDGLTGHQVFDILGPETPTVRDVIDFLADEYGLPRPHFGVPFALAFPFARLMELIDPIVPWEPLIVPSIVHLLQDFGVTNDRAAQVLGYAPQCDWRDAIRAQMTEMTHRQARPMRMIKALD